MAIGRLLVANRGEIARRVIRGAHDAGCEAVAVYAADDVASPHVGEADAAVLLSGGTLAETYLDPDALVRAAKVSGADALHPGYGFLSENPALPEACAPAGVVWVGPPPEAMRVMGHKARAKEVVAAAGVPVLPSVVVEAGSSGSALAAAGSDVGYPLLVKASAGGGGRGMRLVRAADELADAVAAAQREAAAAFGSDEVFLERYLEAPRHIEVQVLADTQGTVLHLLDRECSVQRRHQKVVEEAPAVLVAESARRHMWEAAVAAATAVGYVGVGTVEYLVDASGFYFLEMNTRLQVEHGVTELVSGLDIVREQFLLAAGRPLSGEALAAADRAASPTSHAIEVRLSAEDPGRDFAPAPGRVTRWRMPSGPGIRVDTATEAGDRIPAEYDNLVAKLMVHAGDRAAAIARLRRALDEVEVGGIQTTLPFHLAVAHDPAFARPDDLSTGWVAERWRGSEARSAASRSALLAAALDELDSNHRPGAAAEPAPAEPGFAPARSGVTAVPTHATARPRVGSWRGAARSEGIDRSPR